MIQQLKTNCLFQIMLASTVVIALCVCGIWAYFIHSLLSPVPASLPTEVSKAPPITTPLPDAVPLPTATPPPTATRSGIPLDRQDFIDYFRGKGYEWRATVYDNERYKIVGERNIGSGKIVLWATRDDEEDLIEVDYSFFVPWDNTDQIVKTDIQEMFNLAQFVFPGWKDSEKWLLTSTNHSEGDIEASVNGVRVSLSWGNEEVTRQAVYIFSITE